MLGRQAHGPGGDLGRIDDQGVGLGARHEPPVAQVGPVGERLGDRLEAGGLGGPQQAEPGAPSTASDGSYSAAAATTASAWAGSPIVAWYSAPCGLT